MAPDTNLVFFPSLSRSYDHGLYQRAEAANQSKLRGGVPIGQNRGQVFKVFLESLNSLGMQLNHIRVAFGCGKLSFNSPAFGAQWIQQCYRFVVINCALGYRTDYALYFRLRL